ncbi:hypothetical protein M1L60_41725 [Actinoplanes sp. TRM 88003]|uniref:Uncharacterized protein n=1 Tax=Paractinoplanes aksuensis TaxID=2939490 RepID=A0ABT1E1W4_9ACTN|nr:hypothetical protein [Actinoplanes aksuensis]MCO8277114.1 hypothetical protein [Actinoplanes aksuensis]
MNSTAQDEITEYVERVRAALADLPEATRAELLEDLPEHLAEIRAEDTVTLTDRLGTPEAYAAELRATAAGFVGGFPDPPKRRFEPLQAARADVMKVLGTADVKVGPVLGYPKASDFLRLLRPAWWVLRGYLAAMAVAYFLDAQSTVGLLPRIGNSTLIALVLLAGCIVASIALGRRRFELNQWKRVALYGGTTVLIFFAIGGFFSADSDVRDPGYNDVGYSGGGNPYDYIQDVFVYDNQGRLVPGARLFDQDGQPIQMGNAYCSDESTGEVSHTRSMGYPYCPEAAPFASPAPDATVTADPSEPAEEPKPDPAPTSASPSK